MAHLLLPRGVHRITHDLKAVGLPEIPLIGIHDSLRAVEGLPDHQHAGSLEICYIRSGEQTFAVDGRSYRLRGNDVFLTYPGEPHGNGGHPYDKCLLYWMQIRLSRRNRPFLLLPLSEARPLTEALAHFPVRHFAAAPRLAGHFERAWRLIDAPAAPLRRIQIAMHLLQWLLLVLESAARSTRPPMSEDITRAVTWIGRHPDENPTIEELAALTHLSPSHFQIKFKNQVGMPPREFVMRTKIECARQRIAENSASITDIACQLGFSSSQYFATTFKRFTRLRPSEYRASCRASSHDPAS